MFTIIAVAILIAMIFAPLGCFVLWKKYVYLGDGIAHCAMFAGFVATIFNVQLIYVGVVLSLFFAIAILKFRHNSGNNAAIGLISSLFVALGLILAFFQPGKVNVAKFMVGDIILASQADIITLTIILLLVYSFLGFFYKDLLLMVISNEIAASRGVRVKTLEFWFLVIFSIAILITIKIVGVLLITSAVIIPAMIARNISNSPIQMLGLATISSFIMNISGIATSFYFDVPFAAVAIVWGGVLYLLTLLFAS